MKIVWSSCGRDVIRDILAGRSKALGIAFSWRSTREGYTYWSDVNSNLREGEPLSDEARAKLVAMLLIGEEK